MMFTEVIHSFRKDPELFVKTRVDDLRKNVKYAQNGCVVPILSSFKHILNNFDTTEDENALEWKNATGKQIGMFSVKIKLTDNL